MGPGFPNPIPVELDSISALLLSHLPVLPSLVRLLFMFNWEILVHPCCLCLIACSSRCSNSWARRMWSLNINELPCTPPLQDSLPWGSFKQVTERLKAALLKSTAVILTSALLLPFRILHLCHGHCNQGCPGPHKPNNPSLFVSMRSSKVCFFFGSQSPVAGSYHQCTHKTSRIAHALLCHSSDWKQHW